MTRKVANYENLNSFPKSVKRAGSINVNVMSVSSAHTRDPPPDNGSADQRDPDQRQQHSTPQQERRLITIHTNHGDWTFEVDTDPDSTPRPRTPGQPITIELQPRPRHSHFQPSAQRTGNQDQNKREE